MRQKIVVDRETARMFEHLMKEGHVVSDGSATRRLVRALGESGARNLIYSGYDQQAKKVILAMRRDVLKVRKRKTLKSVIFKLEL